MKTITLISAFAMAFLLPGCDRSETTNHQDQLLQATLWFQQSDELRAIFIQTYYLAGMELESKMAFEYEKLPAVVLDIDETVLDNSPHTARQILDDRAFNNETWDEWCLLCEAGPLPGAVEFTRLASEMGVEVFYISNRGIHLLDATLKNLQKAGFPNADSTHVLLKMGDPGKEARRSKIAETHEILMLIGDNLGDFSVAFEDRLSDQARRSLEEYRDSFGTSFFVLPNPMYGGWEQPFRGRSQEETYLRKLEALESYGVQKE